MPEVQGPKNEREMNEKRRFINEKVVKPPMTARQLAKRGVMMICGAAVCGAVAAVGFAVTMPWAVRTFGSEPVKESHISIPKDVPAETTAVPESTAVPGNAAAGTSAPSEPPIEEKMQSVVENYRYTVDDLNSMISSLRIQALNADKAIVTVHSVQENVDWFDNPMETTGQYAGAVIAHTEQELLILTSESAVEHADSIKVAFAGGKEARGQMKQKDSLAGMAIVSVGVSEIPEGVLSTVRTLPLGNSYIVREGDMLIAVGSPAGVVHSMDYNFVSYVQTGAQMVDQNCRIVYSDILADAEKGTFVLNTAGELVGWAMEPSEDGTGDNRKFTKIIGISDYKGILEKMSNGLSAPYFGIVGQTVPEHVRTMGQSGGIYVMNSVPDSPAYNSGIQNGDIITAINGKTLNTMRDFHSMIDTLVSGQMVYVTVQRYGREAFAELEFQVTIGVR